MNLELALTPPTTFPWRRCRRAAGYALRVAWQLLVAAAPLLTLYKTAAAPPEATR